MISLACAKSKLAVRHVLYVEFLSLLIFESVPLVHLRLCKSLYLLNKKSRVNLVMASTALSDTFPSLATQNLTSSTTISGWPEVEPKSFATSDESMTAAASLFTSSNTTATFDASLLRDPLQLNLKRQIKKLIDVVAVQHLAIESQLPTILEIFNSFAYGIGVVVGKKVLLDAVSRCLSVPQLLESVVDLFRPLLTDLLARWLDDENVDEEVKEERLVALAYVVEVYEEIFPSVFSLSLFLVRYLTLLIIEFLGFCTSFWLNFTLMARLHLLPHIPVYHPQRSKDYIVFSWSISAFSKPTVNFHSSSSGVYHLSAISYGHPNTIKMIMELNYLPLDLTLIKVEWEKGREKR